MIDDNDAHPPGQTDSGAASSPGQSGSGAGDRGMQRFWVPITAGKAVLDPAQVLRLEADGSYTRIHLLNGQRLTVCRSMGVIHAQLPNNRFVRFHNTHVVNIGHVVRLLAAGGHRAVLDNGEAIPVSRRRWKVVNAMFEAWGS